MADIQQGEHLDVADHPDTNFQKAKAALSQYVDQAANSAQNTPARVKSDYKKRMQDQQSDMDFIYGRVGF